MVLDAQDTGQRGGRRRFVGHERGAADALCERDAHISERDALDQGGLRLEHVLGILLGDCRGQRHRGLVHRRERRGIRERIEFRLGAVRNAVIDRRAGRQHERNGGDPEGDRDVAARVRAEGTHPVAEPANLRNHGHGGDLEKRVK